MIYLAFYKSRYGNILDKTVSLWTKGPYSHVELFFRNLGLCYSASPREGIVRFKNINVYDNKWDLLKVTNSPQELYNKCIKELNKNYDWKAIFLSQIAPLNLEEKNKWFCSELCGYILGYERAYTIHPNKLYNLVRGNYEDINSA